VPGKSQAICPTADNTLPLGRYLPSVAQRSSEMGSSLLFGSAVSAAAAHRLLSGPRQIVGRRRVVVGRNRVELCRNPGTLIAQSTARARSARRAIA
jgi:hypothetical protein